MSDSTRNHSKETATPKLPRSESSRIAVIGTAIGSIIGIVGAFIGAFELFSIWGSGSYSVNLYAEHPDLEVFGFLAIFITAAAFTIIPKFKGRRLFSKKLAWESLALIVLGNILVLLTGIVFLPLDDVLIVGGVLLALILVADVLRKPSGPLALAEPFMWLSIVSLLIASVLKTFFDLNSPNSSWNSFSFLEIVLISFPATMIFGIEARTIQFRLVRLKKKALTLSFYLCGLATIVAVLSAIPLELYWDYLLLVTASILFFVSCITFISGVSAHKDGIRKENLDKMNTRNLVRYKYFSRAFRISIIWLVFALFLGITYSIGNLSLNGASLFWVRDAFIHSLAIGFIASAIAAYSPILLPAVISGRAPYLGLTNIPLYIVTAGNIWRVASDLIASVSLTALNLFTGYSGILVIVGMILFVVMNHRLK